MQTNKTKKETSTANDLAMGAQRSYKPQKWKPLS